MKKKHAIVFMMTLMITTYIFPSSHIKADTLSSDEKMSNLSINETFPDKNLATFMKQFDLDEDGTFNEEEINKITTIDLSGRTEIQSLNGINTLTNLQELNCSDMYLTTLDVSALSKLQTMLASDNQFSQIDLTNNVSLEVLNISSNPLTSIDLTHLTNLSYLNCDQTLLSALDVSNNVNLYFLSLDSTNVQYLDLSKNTKLSDFSGDKVNLGYLHLPSNGNLKQIYLNKTQTVPITVDKTSFDLSSLFPGIEASQISNVQQAEITGTTISNYTLGKAISYDYNCGNVDGEPFFLHVSLQTVLENSWTQELTIQDISYGQIPQPSASSSFGTVTYLYSTSIDGPFEVETKLLPKDAGTYYCKAYVKGTSKYTELLSNAKAFQIKQADNAWIKELTINDTPYGGTLDYSAQAKFGSVRYVFSSSISGNYEEQVPNEAGTYYIKAIVDEHTNYKKLESNPIQFTISPVDNYWLKNLSISDWTYGQTASTPQAQSKYGSITFEYSQDKDSGYAPLPQNPNAGTWYVRAKVDGTASYTELVSEPVAFVIHKAESQILIDTDSLDKDYDGQSVEEIQYHTNGSKGTIETYYEKWNGSTWERCQEDPILPGNYRVVIILDEDANYNGASKTFAFTINKLQNSWQVKPSIANVTYGEKLTLLGKALYGEPTTSYSSSLQGSYKEGLPTNAGHWYIKVSVADSELYQGLSEIVTVDIHKALPTYTIPTALHAAYGDSLKDIALPKGFVWEQPSQMITDIGTLTFHASYIPDDTINYQTIKQIPIEISSAKGQNQLVSMDLSAFVWGNDLSKFNVKTKFGKPRLRFSKDPNGIFTTRLPDSIGTWYVKVSVKGNAYYDAYTSESFTFEVTARKLTEKDVTIHLSSLQDLKIQFQGKMLQKGVDYDVQTRKIDQGWIFDITFKDKYSGMIQKTLLTQQNKPEETTGQESINTQPDNNTSTGTNDEITSAEKEQNKPNDTDAFKQEEKKEDDAAITSSESSTVLRIAFAIVLVAVIGSLIFYKKNKIK